MKTQFIASADGVRIAYEVHGNGPALCLLHGFSGNRALRSDYGWIERLRSHFTIVALDMRGCGESDAPLDPQSYTVQAHCADVAAVTGNCGIEAFLLWGWSFGGTLGLHMAAHSPHVERAVIGGTYFGRIFTEEYVQQRLSQASSPIERARWNGLGSWPSIEPRALRCPTLIYTGSADGNVVVQLERQRTVIEEAGMHLHVFDGFRHGQLISAQDTIAALVLPFLNASAQGIRGE